MTCSAPNCTVSPIAASNTMMRPVILSRPLKVAVRFSMRWAGGATTTKSSEPGGTAPAGEGGVWVWMPGAAGCGIAPGRAA